MRVAIDARRAAAHWTGIGRYVTALAQGLPAQGVHLEPLSGRTRVTVGVGETVGDLTSRLPKLEWEQIALPVHLRRTAPDVLHLPWYEGPVIKAVPMVVTIHDLDTIIHADRYSRVFRSYYNSLARWYARRADWIIVPSPATADDLASVLGRSDRVEIIPQGVDSVFFNSDVDLGARLRQRLGIASSQVLVLNASGVGLRKNHDVLARALCSLRRQGVPVIGVITGSESVPAVYDEMGAPAIATGILASDEVAALYSVADVCVAPSAYEGFGFSVAEGLAAGCRTVASAVGSHMFIGGDSVRYFDHRDDHALAAEIRAVLDEGIEARAELTRGGRLRAEVFDWSRTCEKTAQVYGKATR